MSDGNSLTGTHSPALTLNSLVASNAGTYTVVISNAAGNVTSSNVIVSVNTTITAPSFTLPGASEPPASSTVAEGGSVTLSAAAVGTGPISYLWYFNDGTTTVSTGVTSLTLTLSGVSPTQAGTYYVVATGGTSLTGQSSNAVLTVTTPASVTIGYLRSLLNPTTYQPANTTTLYNITGVITTATNLTTGDTASYYIQDSTGGINLFVTDGSDFRPQLGDVVTATGTLSTYADNYELDVIEGTRYLVDTIISHNAPQPTPILLPWGNNPAPLSASLATNVEGSVVLITNLYFAAYTPGAVFVSGSNYIISNSAGLTYTVYVSDQDTNLVAGQPIPQHAYSIAGPLVQDNLVVGIEFTVYSNLVVSPPVTITNVTGAISGGTNFTLTWTAVPTTASYSVLYSTNLAQPLMNWTRLATGLTFGTSSGTYTSSLQTNSANFYEVSSP